MGDLDATGPPIPSSPLGATLLPDLTSALSLGSSRKPDRKDYPGAPGKLGRRNGAAVQRRIVGFGLGFEKIFKTTSIKLPVSAYTVYVDLKLIHNDFTEGRCFNGLHTVHDLKKWIFEACRVPMDAYELSYAEPGKARIDDKLRLLTTQDSLDTRSLASMRAVHGVAKGIPGVHSIDDMGVTRLYVRLKCRSCGELYNNLQNCRRHAVDEDKEPVEHEGDVTTWNITIKKDEMGVAAGLRFDSKQRAGGKYGVEVHRICSGSPVDVFNKEFPDKAIRSGDKITMMNGNSGETMWRSIGSLMMVKDVTLTVKRAKRNLPLDRESEPITSSVQVSHRPDTGKKCLVEMKAYEMYEAARSASKTSSEIAQILISMDESPSQKLRIGKSVLLKDMPKGVLSATDPM